MTAPSVSPSEPLSNLLFRRSAVLTRLKFGLEVIVSGVSGSRARLSEVITADGSKGKGFTLSERRGDTGPEAETFASFDVLIEKRLVEGFKLEDFPPLCGVSALA